MTLKERIDDNGASTEPVIPERLRRRAMEAANEIEAAERLTPDMLELIYEERLFKLFVPDELGGRMTSLPDAARIFEEAAYLDGSFGWLVTIGSGGGFFAATLPEATAKALFSDRRAVIAGSGHATGIAEAVPGGYRVSGSWKYCSGSGYASFFTANCIVKRTGEAPDSVLVPSPEIRSFAFLPEQVEIVRDWNAMGLKATESHTIRVSDVFVPQERTFDIASPPRYDDPIYRYPFLPFAQVSFAAVVLGLGRRYLDEADRLAHAKRAEWDRGYPGRFERVAGCIAERRELVTSAADLFYRTTQASWETFGTNGALADEVSREVGEACRAAARTSVAGAQALQPMLGMTALMERETVNRVWRDLHTAAQHGVLNME